MKFLFLDFDGVLNSTDWAERRPTREEFAVERNVSPEMYSHQLYIWRLRSIDPAAVARLNRIVEETGARVVVSSTWRTQWPLTKLNWMLRERGFEHHLVGTTPDKWDMSARADRAPEDKLVRGDEIAAWLKMFSGYVTESRIVILDDDADMAPYMSRLVKTDHSFGLTDDDADRAIWMLNNQ